MATGGIFQLVTNDGKQDRMLMASALLHERLDAINRQKASMNAAQGRSGDLNSLENLPTLLDIEKTHVLFTNAHFKPFAAMAFEYNKVRISSGSAALQQKIQFSIPQFGDFFHDICARVVLRQPTLTVGGDAVNSQAPAMRWAHFPGERLFKEVTQEVNGNPLDKYTSHSVNFHREFRVANNKKVSWYRCVGQELPEEGYVSQPNWSGNGRAAPSHRLKAEVVVGAQTPTGQKSTADAGNLEMFIPLLFWYNKDVRLAVPSVAIPHGQRFINIETCEFADLVGVFPRGTATFSALNGTLAEHASGTIKTFELYINNIFVNPEVHKIYIKRIGFSLIRVHREQTYTVSSGTTTGDLLLQQLKWPIEYLFVGFKVAAYHASSSAASKAEHLDKWHMFSSISAQTYRTDGQSVMYEEPVAASGIATTGTAGATTGAIAALVTLAVGDLVRLNGVMFRVTTGVTAGANIGGTVVVEPTNVAVSAGALTRITFQGLQVATQRPARIVDTITIKAHGITLYDSFPVGFFNAYTPYHYGGSNISTPEDSNAMFVPFCLYPGTYQPSGHINLSRAREFYLSFDGTSAGVLASNNVTLVVVASAINFLLISDGSAVLRYST